MLGSAVVHVGAVRAICTSRPVIYLGRLAALAALTALVMACQSMSGTAVALQDAQSINQAMMLKSRRTSWGRTLSAVGLS